MTASPLRKWWHSAARARRHGLALLPPVQLPFPEDRARATVARYRALFAAVSKTGDAVAEAMASGALTPVEALAVVRRHAKRLQFDLAAMEKDEVRT
jgi:hypothetical protein